jgi:hypothetical protein
MHKHEAGVHLLINKVYEHQLFQQHQYVYGTVLPNALMAGDHLCSDNCIPLWIIGIRYNHIIGCRRYPLKCDWLQRPAGLLTKQRHA